MKKNLLYPLVLLFLLTACSDFLEEYSQNGTYVESVNDLDELLRGECYLPREIPLIPDLKLDGWLSYLHLLADESREAPVPRANFYKSEQLWQNLRGFWGWYEDPFMKADGSTYEDKDWPAFYKRISVINSILSIAPDYQGDSKKNNARLSRIIGECHYLRAWNYFMLANLYGMPYDKANPNDGGSVTLKLDAKVEESKFSRAHTGEVYQQIINDLKQAASWLESGESATSKYQVNPASCYALLSRVYLYMEEYPNAVEAAGKVEGYQLFDLVRNYVPGSGISFLTVNSPEVIFAQGRYGVFLLHEGTGDYETRYVFDPGPPPQYVATKIPVTFGHSFNVSDEMLNLFDPNDLRLSAFFARSHEKQLLVCRKYRTKLDGFYETDPITGDTLTFKSDGASCGEIGSIRYGEVVLNKAEAQACMGDAGAVATIKAFLETRYKVLPAVPSGGEELIGFIRNERRKELCYEGHRWFDLRRYAVNKVSPYAPSIKHEYHIVENQLASIKGNFTLKPFSEQSKGSWMLPVPPEVIDFCFPNITNPDRLQGVTETIY